MPLSTRPGLTLVLATLLSPLLVAANPAFERTEEREPCAHYNPGRNLFFGDTHIHTAYSLDAFILDVRNTPADAYRFARGEPLPVPDYASREHGEREVRLLRPLDFAMVSDHAETLGEVRLCATPGSQAYDSRFCQLVRRWPRLAYMTLNASYFTDRNPTRASFCGEDGADCRRLARGPWQDIQAAAETAYDRSSECRFTTFIGYEYSPVPGGDMLHRNVMFRNHRVQDLPTSYIEEPRVEGLWDRLEDECLDRGDGCDVLAIPHNSNLSGGRMFLPVDSAGNPLDRHYAERRARLEPVVEIIQHKGASECHPAGLGNDELCGFELLPYPRMTDARALPARFWQTPPPGSYVRPALGLGLQVEERSGANPFKLGMIGATDTHFATAGLTEQHDYPGHGAGDRRSGRGLAMADDLRMNPGGLAAVWAEENSRDAIFEAFRRREVYATSGPRISLRFFGGWDYAETMCEDPDFAGAGYAGGVPMGGDLPGPTHTDQAPVFALFALADSGISSSPGTDLQALQVVKGWLENGELRERVYTVAGQASSSAGADPMTCAMQGRGERQICTLWRDPEFAEDQRAYYYARVLELPSCRWQTHACVARGIRCDQPETMKGGFEDCCTGVVPATVQQRAWSSPIWYTPALSRTKTVEEANPER